MTLHLGKLAMAIGVLLATSAGPLTARDPAESASVPAEQIARLNDLANSPATGADNPSELLQQAVDLAYDLIDAYPDAQDLSVVHEHLLAAARALQALQPSELNLQQLISACQDVLDTGQPGQRLTADINLAQLAVDDADTPDQDKQATLRILVRKYAESDVEVDALIAGAALAGRLQMTDLFNEFVDQLAADHTDKGQAARFLVRVGRPAPFVATLTTLDGDELSLPDDLVGKVVLVVFWASDCPQSRRCEPHLRKLYAAYRDEGLEIVAISLDGPDRAVLLRDYAAENDLGWIQTYSGQGIEDPTFVHYGLDEKPAFWLVGATGNILTDDALVAVGDASRTASLDNIDIYVRWALKLPAATDTTP